MPLFRSLLLFICLLCFHFSLFSQRTGSIRSSPDPKEEYDLLLAQSQTLKTKAIVALATGPLMAGAGFYLLNKESSTTWSGSGSWISVRDNNSTNQVVGTILATAGTLATITIIPLFIKSAKAKKQANLLVSDQSTSFLNYRIAVPSLGVRISL